MRTAAYYVFALTILAALFVVGLAAWLVKGKRGAW